MGQSNSWNQNICKQGFIRLSIKQTKLNGQVCGIKTIAGILVLEEKQETVLEFKKSLSIPKAARFTARHLKINELFWTFKKQTKLLSFPSRFSGAASLGFFPREPFHLRTLIPVLQVFTLLRSAFSAILA